MHCTQVPLSQRVGITVSNIADGGLQVLPTIYELVQREDYTSPDGKVTKKGELSGISAMITISHPGCQGLGGSAKMRYCINLSNYLIPLSQHLQFGSIFWAPNNTPTFKNINSFYYDYYVVMHVSIICEP